MSAGAGTPAEHSGLRDAPGDLGASMHAPKGLRRLWQRWYLVPLCLLMVAVIVATVIGIVQRDRLREAAFAPPVAEVTQGQGLPSACAPGAVSLPDQQPWLAQARSSSEQTFNLHVSGAAATVEGRNGWVFWNDLQANNISQALGRRVLSQAEMNGWYAAMDSLRDRLAERGIDFVIQVVPAKWSVYPQQLPDWSDNVRGSTTLDYLRYAHPDLPIMDMRPALRAAAADGDVYTPLNSHWSAYGGTVGWASLAECLTSVNPERYAGLAPLDMTSVASAPESNEFEPFGFASAGPYTTQPVWASAPGQITVTTPEAAGVAAPADQAIDMLELPATTNNPASQSPATALILRDSQGNNIGAGWQSGFATTWQYAHNLDKPDQAVNYLELAEQHQPDVVILEVTERHLNFVPPITY